MSQAEFYYQNSNAPLPNMPTRMGACVILRHGNKIVFEKRQDCGNWALIGGGLELNESLESCILREIYEETGLVIYQEDLQFHKMFSDPSRIIKYSDSNIARIVTATFIVELSEMAFLKCSNESFELAYIDIESISKYEIVATHKHIIEDYISIRI